MRNRESITYMMVSSTERVFALPELLEPILLYLLEELSPFSYQEDPRNSRVYNNANVLQHLLNCSQVCKQWKATIQHSAPIQRALFLLPDPNSDRTWTQGHSKTDDIDVQESPTRPAIQPPTLNPIIQTTFKSYHFRYWHLSFEASGNKHCAYMIIEKRDIPDFKTRAMTGQGKNISSMLLSQPPCTALEATIWDERDETRDYVGRTMELRDSVITNDGGLTIGMVHEKVAEMFAEHPDVSAIKLTTM
jgi:hypothetical protein